MNFLDISNIQRGNTEFVKYVHLAPQNADCKADGLSQPPLSFTYTEA